MLSIRKTPKKNTNLYQCVFIYTLTVFISSFGSVYFQEEKLQNPKEPNGSIFDCRYVQNQNFQLFILIPYILQSFFISQKIFLFQLLNSNRSASSDFYYFSNFIERYLCFLIIKICNTASLNIQLIHSLCIIYRRFVKNKMAHFTSERGIERKSQSGEKNETTYSSREIAQK